MGTLLVFIAVATLSVLASNQRLLQAGRFFNLAQLAASGLIFLVLGAALGPGALGLLNSLELEGARPILALGLGLAGLLVGLNLEPGLLRALPARVWLASGAQSGAAFLAVAVPVAVVFFAATNLSAPVALGAAAVLGGAAAVSSSHFAVLWFRTGRLDRLRGVGISLVAILDDLTGIAVLAVALVLGADPSISVSAGLVLLAVLIGILCGALTAYLIQDARGAELTAILLGAVGLVSGAAAFLKVSALIAGLACGATMAFIGGRSVALASRALGRTERPVYLALLFLVGAHLTLGDWFAWIILPVFVALRFLGKLVGGRLAIRAAAGSLPLPPEPGYALIAQGGVSMCLLIEYVVLVGGPTSQLIFNVGILAAVVNEVLGSRAFHRSIGPHYRRRRGGGSAPPSSDSAEDSPEAPSEAPAPEVRA